MISNEESRKPNYDKSLQLDQVEALFKNLYSLPRGEELVEILRIFKYAILTHVHSYHLVPATPSEQNTSKLIEENFTNLLNKNIKIN